MTNYVIGIIDDDPINVLDIKRVFMRYAKLNGCKFEFRSFFYSAKSFAIFLLTMAQTQSSDQTLTAVSIMSIMVKIGRMIPMMPMGAPIPDINESVRK